MPRILATDSLRLLEKAEDGRGSRAAFRQSDTAFGTPHRQEAVTLVGGRLYHRSHMFRVYVSHVKYR